METLIFLLLLGWSDEVYIAQDTIYMEYPIAVPYLTDSILCVWRKGEMWSAIPIKGSFFDGSSWSTSEQLTPDSLSDLPYWSGRPGLTVDSSNNIWISWGYGDHPTKQKTTKYIERGIYTRTYDGTGWGVPAYADSLAKFTAICELSMCTAKDGKVFVGYTEDTDVDVNGTVHGWGSVVIGWHEDSDWSTPFGIVGAWHSYIDSCVWDYWRPSLATDTSNSIFIAYEKRHAWPFSKDTAIIIDKFQEDSLIEIGRKEGGNNWNPVIDIDSYNKLWLVWVSDRDGDMNVYSSYYQDGVWSEDMQITTDSFADLEPSIVCHKNGVPWITWTSKKDSSIWSAYYVGRDWHPERVSEEDSSYNSNPCIIEGPQGKLWVFWQKVKGDTNSICCSWRELVGAEEPTPYTLTPKPQLKVYPNPFTSKTVIRYSLPVDYTINDSRLTIHDISGRLIQTFHLTNDQSQVVWDTKELPGGVYFLHLNMGDIKEVKKLTLIR